jgi:A/G-specific adenine glycosylase
MLQQTRVAAVLEYYERFLRRFPDVQSLARAPFSDVLAAWSGLGYYRRARNLHRAAKMVAKMAARTGAFPRLAVELRELPGIGRYTAAAIASIAFGECCAVVDGNVERVLARLSGRKLPARETWALAEQMVSAHSPGNFNQAMMELGATVCLPGAPLCAKCPVREWCGHRKGSHKADDDRVSPVGRSLLTGARSETPRRKRHVAFLLNISEECVLLVQRPPGASQMPGMWELPAIARQSRTGKPAPAMRLRHSITNTDFAIDVLRSRARPRHAQWIALARLQQLPLTGLARKILRRADVM